MKRRHLQNIQSFETSTESGNLQGYDEQTVYIVRSMGFGRVLFQQRSAETVYRHLHHPAKNN